MLIDDVKKREREKLRISHLQKQYAETIFFPIIPIVEPILEKMEGLDKEDLFLNLVSREEAPDYYDIVKNPMSWSIMSDKMIDRKYETVADFEVLYRCQTLVDIRLT